jgi:hypothetical protein
MIVRVAEDRGAMRRVLVRYADDFAFDKMGKVPCPRISGLQGCPALTMRLPELLDARARAWTADPYGAVEPHHRKRDHLDRDIIWILQRIAAGGIGQLSLEMIPHVLDFSFSEAFLASHPGAEQLFASAGLELVSAMQAADAFRNDAVPHEHQDCLSASIETLRRAEKRISGRRSDGVADKVVRAVGERCREGWNSPRRQAFWEFVGGV